MPGSEQYIFPSWSPDGNWMVAAAENPPRMVLYSAAKKTWSNLKLLDEQWGYWTWANDSKSIYTGLISTQSGAVYRLTVPDGAWTKVSGLEGINVPLRADNFVSLTADGRPAIMSHTDVSQIYSLAWKR